jgi:RNA polymerase sigma factor (sigma-70 family)
VNELAFTTQIKPKIMELELENIDDGTILLIKSQDEETRSWVMINYAEFGFRYLLKHYTPTFTVAECRGIANSCVVALISNVELDKYEYRSGSKTTTYFTPIVKNTAENYRKKGLKTQSSIDIATIAKRETIIEMEEEKIDLEELLLKFIKTSLSKGMKQSCQEIIILKHIKKLRHKIIAKRMKYTEKHSRNRLYRCMKYLRKAIEVKFNDENISREKLLTYLMNNQ